MTSRLWFFPMLLLSLLLISATTTVTEPKLQVSENPVVSRLPASASSVKKNKLSFIERLLVKYVAYKVRKAEGDVTKANKQASTSLTFGIVAVSALLLGLFIPFVVLLTIPAGIVALATGSSALKSGTTETGKAHTGKALGLASLIAFGAIMVLAIILLATLFNNWG